MRLIKGWLPLHRNEFEKNFHDCGAAPVALYYWFYLNACYEETNVWIRSINRNLERGEILTSIRDIKKRWRMHHQTIAKALDALELRGLIKKQSVDPLIIKVLQYNENTAISRVESDTKRVYINTGIENIDSNSVNRACQNRHLSNKEKKEINSNIETYQESFSQEEKVASEKPKKPKNPPPQAVIDLAKEWLIHAEKVHGDAYELDDFTKSIQTMMKKKGLNIDQARAIYRHVSEPKRGHGFSWYGLFSIPKYWNKRTKGVRKVDSVINSIRREKPILYRKLWNDEGSTKKDFCNESQLSALFG